MERSSVKLAGFGMAIHYDVWTHSEASPCRLRCRVVARRPATTRSLAATASFFPPFFCPPSFCPPFFCQKDDGQKDEEDLKRTQPRCKRGTAFELGGRLSGDVGNPGIG